MNKKSKVYPLLASCLLTIFLISCVALAAEANTAPQIEGTFRLKIDPLAATAEESIRRGEAIDEGKPGELLLIAGRGFGNDSSAVIVSFNDEQVKVFSPPLLNSTRLIVSIPYAPSGSVTIRVTVGGRKSEEVKFTILPQKSAEEVRPQPAGKVSKRTFLLIDEFLFLAGKTIETSSPMVPILFQGFAERTLDLLNRDRLMALQLQGTLEQLSERELELLDALFVSVGLPPLLEEYIKILYGGVGDKAQVMEGVRRVCLFKGSALKIVGEFFSTTTVMVWDRRQVTSVATKNLGSMFKALGEFDQDLGSGNIAFLATLLIEEYRKGQMISLQNSIADLATSLDDIVIPSITLMTRRVSELGAKVDELMPGIAALEEKLDDPQFGLKALKDEIDEIESKLDRMPSITAIERKLDDSHTGLASIKGEVEEIESKLDMAVIPGISYLLSGIGMEKIDEVVIPSIAALERKLDDPYSGLVSIKDELESIESKLDDPESGLEEIKSEVKDIEGKVEKIWNCLTSLTIVTEEAPVAAERAQVDVILAIDSSGSMKTNDPRRLRLDAAKRFVNLLDPREDQVGVVSWDNDIDSTQPLTDDFTQVELMIDRVDASGATNLNIGLNTAINEFIQAREDTAKVIIFLTDGDGAYTFSGQSGSPARVAQQKGIKIYAIGLGAAPVMRKLEDMANATGGKVYMAPTAEDLREIYEEISEQLVTPAERILKITCEIDDPK